MSQSIASTAAKVAKPSRVHNPPVHAPTSPFATLLRRSRFASFDPTIRQTYFAPDAHANRGDYGTKRPLPVRRRNSFVTIASFDEHHNYTEWTRGESQVRFLRRFEELNVTPGSDKASPWSRKVGRTLRDSWLVDSEFNHPQSSVYDGSTSKLSPEPILGHQVKPVVRSLPLPTISAQPLGKPTTAKGTGRYGHARSSIPHISVQSNLISAAPQLELAELQDRPASERFLVPNMTAMSPKRQRAYLRKLRSLRPEFAQVLAERDYEQRLAAEEAKAAAEERQAQADAQARAELEGTAAGTTQAEAVPTEQMSRDATQVITPRSANVLEYAGGKDSFELQKEFLYAQAQKTFHSPNYFKERDGRPVIMPLPHPVAGLSYAHPSPLQTKIGTRYAVSKYFPGYILHPSMSHTGSGSESRYQDRRSSHTFVAAIGGFSSRVRSVPHETVNKRSLYNPFKSLQEGGGISPDPTHIEEATAEFTLRLEPQESTKAHVVMWRAPDVVERFRNRRGNPAGLNGAIVRTEFSLRDKTGGSAFDSNPYWPGSRLYNVGNPKYVQDFTNQQHSAAESNVAIGKRGKMPKKLRIPTFGKDRSQRVSPAATQQREQMMSKLQDLVKSPVGSKSDL